MYRVLKRMQDGVNLFISSRTRYIQSVLPLRGEVLNIERGITNEVLEDLTCALEDRVSTTRVIGLLNKPYACMIKRNSLEGKHFVTSESVFLDTLYRLQDSEACSFFSFLLHKRVIISIRIEPKLDVYAITLCSWLCPPNKFIKLNSDGSFKDGVGGGGGVLRDHLGLVRGIYSVPFAHCNSAFEAEVRSLSIGLAMAYKWGIRDLIIELDNIDVVQVLQGSRALSSLEKKVLRELPISEFNYTSSSVLRESNEAANLLAILARGCLTTPSSMLEDTRYKAWQKVMKQCQRDLEGDTYFRLRYLRKDSSYTPTSLTSDRNLQILNLSPMGSVSDGLLNIKKRYLHSTCLPPVTHSNLKAANILLHELMPRLSGCGLAVLRPITSNSIKLKASEMAIGNTGYVAPERIQNGFESAKGNTYAFGLLLLKLSTGKRPLHGFRPQEDSLRPQEEQSLVKWASSWLRYNESLEKMVDPNIQKPLWSRALSRSGVIVSLCVQKDAVVREKRKRGPLTEEKKEKKKKKKRIKRAETNKRLGVKRLKIQPILKPKTVTYCRHYLRGRCQEGEKCKFSHDTIPLTKSKPCCHFARNSCMKGDDCPYDHDLSKYPCNNFSSKGSCSRGTDCRFLHEVQPVDGSSDTIAQLKVQPVEGSSDTTAQVKSPPLLRSADSEKQSNTQASSNQKVDSKTVSTYKRPPLRKRTQEIVSESVLNPAVQTPKGISKLMFGVPNQAGSFPKADAGLKFGLPLKPNTLDITQNSKESSRMTEALESKGINFLSFGKAPLHDSSSKNPSGLSVTKDIGVRKTTSCDSSKEKQSAFSLQKDDGLKVGNQNQSKRTPAVGPRGINFLSFGKARLDDSCNRKLVNMPSNGNNNAPVSSVEERASASNGKTYVVMSSAQESGSASKLQTPGAEPGRVLSSSSSVQARESGSKLQMPGAKPWKMLSSSLHSVLSLDRTADEHGKDTPSSSLKALFSSTPNSAQKCNVSSMPNSTQKSLQTMLAFAAKYDSSIKVDMPTVTADSNKASSSSQSTARGSTILDLLNVGGSKTKQ